MVVVSWKVIMKYLVFSLLTIFRDDKHTQTHRTNVFYTDDIHTDRERHNGEIMIIISMRFCAIRGVIDLAVLYLRG